MYKVLLEWSYLPRRSLVNKISLTSELLDYLTRPDKLDTKLEKQIRVFSESMSLRNEDREIWREFSRERYNNAFGYDDQGPIYQAEVSRKHREALTAVLLDLRMHYRSQLRSLTEISLTRRRRRLKARLRVPPLLASRNNVQKSKTYQEERPLPCIRAKI